MATCSVSSPETITHCMFPSSLLQKTAFSAGRREALVSEGLSHMSVSLSFKQHKEPCALIYSRRSSSQQLGSLALSMDDRIMPRLLFICSILHVFHGFNAASPLSDRSSANNYLQVSHVTPATTAVVSSLLLFRLLGWFHKHLPGCAL